MWGGDGSFNNNNNNNNSNNNNNDNNNNNYNGKIPGNINIPELQKIHVTLLSTAHLLRPAPLHQVETLFASQSPWFGPGR